MAGTYASNAEGSQSATYSSTTFNDSSWDQGSVYTVALTTRSISPVGRAKPWSRP